MKNHLAKTGSVMMNIVHGPFCNHANSLQDQLTGELNWPGPVFQMENNEI